MALAKRSSGATKSTKLASSTSAKSAKSTSTKSTSAKAPSVKSAKSTSAKSTSTKSTKTTSAKSASRSAAGKAIGKRERIDTTPNKAGGSRFIRRDSEGQFTKDQVSVGKSLAADRRTKAKTKATTGNKDRGD